VKKQIYAFIFLMKKIVFLLMLFFPYFLFGQYQYIQKYMFVSAGEGLESKQSPSYNSNVNGIIPCGQLLFLTYKTIEKDTINGISDYWYYANQMGANNGWVFGGYLTKRFTSNLFLGNWSQGGDSYWVFENDGWFRTGIRETDAGTRGNFKFVDKNNLILTYFEWDDEREGFIEYNSSEIKLQFINSDRMLLIFNKNRIVELIRDNGWE